MIFDWYLIFNRTQWEAENLVSRIITLRLEDKGEVELLIARGFNTCIVYDGILLPVPKQNEEPLYIGLDNKYAVYVDKNDDVYFGFLNEEAST